MPGYLTSMMILIKADAWLDEVQQRLSAKSARTPLEEKLLVRAGQARAYVRFAPDGTWPQKLPAWRLPEIDNHIGDKISQFAYAGVIGPVFPRAANILALNQSWVANTLHNGAVRTAFQNAHSTSLVLDAIRQANIEAVIQAVNGDEEKGRFYAPAASADQRFVAALKPPLMAFLFGHLAGVAAHVILRPFINARAWAEGVDHRQIDVELDAQVARGFFKRADLQSGQSWTAYFVDESDGVRLIGELLFQAYKRIYGADPSEPLCALPPLAELRQRFPGLDGVIQNHPDLEAKLAHYSGYDTLVKSYPDNLRDALKRELDAVDSLARLLKDYKCKTPQVSRDFMIDGYKNTRNWALDAGYDHGPWHYRLLLGMVLIVATVPMFWLLIGSNFDTSETKRIKLWRENGLKNERLIFDCLDASYTVGVGLMQIGLGVLLNSPIPKTDFIFGQGTTGFFERPAGVITFKLSKYSYTGTKLLLKVIGTKSKDLADFLDQLYFRWPRLLADAVLDILDNLVVSKRVADKGIEGNELSRWLWYSGLILAAIYSVASLVTFGIKSKLNDDDGNRQSGLQPLDYFLSMGFVSIGYFIFASLGFFDNWLLKPLIGMSWPTTETGRISAYLPLMPDGVDSMKFATSGARTFAVKVFAEGDMNSVQGQPAYPQDLDPRTAWAERMTRDEAARRAKASDSTVRDYTLTSLFDRATYLAGTLMMMAAAVDAGTQSEQQAARAVFQDWNLDYRTQMEWDALMETAPGDRAGLARAAEQWWNGATDQAVIEPLEDIFGVRDRPPVGATHYGRIEDRSAAPYNNRSDTGHKYLANTPFIIVDSQGATVVSGTTDANGNYSATLPPGQGYELRIAGYDGVGP